VVGWVRIQLASDLGVGKSALLHVSLVFTRVIVPFPSEIRQNENQLVSYDDYLYYFSAYKTKEQGTHIRLPSSKVESYTKTSANLKGEDMTYGPFYDISPANSLPLNLHYENNNPFVTFTSLKKLIEVSHFGNVNVEEWYMLEHTGARLKGSFSRFEYQRSQLKGASFRHITAILPPHATDLYYRDQIGNISTSHVRDTDEMVQFDIEPRFPMFGGWKTDFYIGYNLPADKYLSLDASNSNSYILNISFGSPFPQAAIDEEEVHVILPELSSNIKWVTPFEIDDEGRDVHVTYLDTVGRPVLILKKKKCHASP